MNAYQLIKAAISHDKQALAKRSKADKETARRMAMEAKVAELNKKIQQSFHKENMLMVSVVEHEAAVSQCLNEARLDFTKDMDGPSEERAQSWNTFYECVMRGQR